LARCTPRTVSTRPPAAGDLLPDRRSFEPGEALGDLVAASLLLPALGHLVHYITAFACFLPGAALEGRSMLMRDSAPLPGLVALSLAAIPLKARLDRG
jgi:hypothetical protein